MATRSDQQIALGRRPARMGRIDGLRSVAEVLQYPFDDGRIFDARDHLELPAAAPAGLDVNGKQSVQSQVRVLVAGASTYICDECIGRSVEILSDMSSAEAQEGMVEVLLNPGIELTIASHRLKTLIDRTEFAMGDQDRLPFNGLLMEIESDRLRAVATNGHHLAMAETPANCPMTTTQRMILARDSVRELGKTLDTVDGDIAISVRDNRFHVERAGLACSVDLLLGRYPNYRAVVPEHSDSIVVDRRDLLSLTSRHLAATSGLLRCALTKGSLRISCYRKGDELERIDVDYHGRDVSGCFTPRYLNGPLNAIEGTLVKLSFSADHPAWRIESPDDDSSVYVVMSGRSE